MLMRGEKQVLVLLPEDLHCLLFVTYDSVRFSAYFLICDFFSLSVLERLKIIVAVLQMNKLKRIR